MGVDLHGRNRSLHLNNVGWVTLLYLAHLHGWKPEGTEPPPFDNYDDWNGNYTTNDFQYVTAEDASKLADGLERAHRCHCAHAKRSEEAEMQLDENDMREELPNLFHREDLPNPFQEFIDFFREDGFQIG